jgi:phosphoribosylaminoimidazole-succinocarboxamide synthase
VETKELLLDGATKKVYATNQADQVIVVYQGITGGKGKKKGSEDHAELNNSVSAYLFEYLESYNVPTHFIRKLDEKSFLAKRTELIPIIIAMYNVASASLADRLGIEEGKVLEYPIVEMYLNDEKKQRPMINEYHAYALGLCERREMASIIRIATKVNAVLKSFFDRKRLKLVSFRLQFGRLHHQILLVDEVSLDTVNLWFVNEDGSFEKTGEDEQKSKEDYQKLKANLLGE